MQHIPVFFEEALAALAIKKHGIYVDGTFGRGGHSNGILSQLGEDGRLYAIDKDPTACDFAEKTILDPRFQISQASYAEIADLSEVWKIAGKIDGILLDLGVSSPQLDDAARGFSFLQAGPLDMRMDTTQGETAAQWINRVDLETMANVFWTYGEERFSRRIAQAIVRERAIAPIQKTDQLAEIVKTAHPAWPKNKHPATRVFQAIRIHLNNELGDLQQFLAVAFALLAPTGRLCIISFHSLEDRLVKQAFKGYVTAETKKLPKNLPIPAEHLSPQARIVIKKMKPDLAACQQNPRARSAVMRVLEKLS